MKQVNTDQNIEGLIAEVNRLREKYRQSRSTVYQDIIEVERERVMYFLRKKAEKLKIPFKSIQKRILNP